MTRHLRQLGLKRTVARQRLSESSHATLVGWTYVFQLDVYNVHMTSLRFEWEARKASSNLKKHGISFKEAKSVFYDESAKLISDP